jgi:hypothetical protein
MPSMPTQAELLTSLGQIFSLTPGAASSADDEPHWSVPLTLAAVDEGIAMDDAYVCYSASFDLPQGVVLPQDVYCLTAPDGSAWELLITPNRPRAGGIATMCAVFHLERPVEMLAVP